MPTREDWQQGGHLRPLPCGPLWSGGSQVTNHVLPTFTDLALEGRPTGREPQPNRRPGKAGLGLWQGLRLAGFLLVHNRMAQVKANRTEAKAKGFLAFSMSMTQEPRPGTREEPPGLGGRGETLRKTQLAPGTCPGGRHGNQGRPRGGCPCVSRVCAPLHVYEPGFAPLQWVVGHLPGDPISFSS